MADIVLDGISKRFDDGYEAVKDMDLEVKDGEFVILVGPSGCGKSTALRMIAGLEDITEGELRIGGDVVNQYAPKDRDIAMVFQNYALYPHMSVRENMAFPLKLAKVPEEEIRSKVEDAAKILDLEQHLDRKPANLSGGQRQRVAMGRAIVRDPKAFLMDEPLSNLDAKLRVQMRTEVARLQKDLNTTTVYVTHDQTEAMTLGDRVAVMRSGMLQQVDTPAVLYEKPVNLFVAGFIGSPAMNFMPARFESGIAKLPFGDVRLPDEVRSALGDREGRDVIAGRARRHSRMPPWSARPRTAATRSRRRSTWSSRWAPSSTPTSRSRPSACSRRSSRSSPPTPAPPRSPVVASTRSSPASTRRARSSAALRPSSGSTPRPCSSLTRRTANGSGPSRDRRAPAPYGLSRRR